MTPAIDIGPAIMFTTEDAGRFVCISSQPFSWGDAEDALDRQDVGADLDALAVFSMRWRHPFAETVKVQDQMWRWRCQICNMTFVRDPR